MLDHQDTKLIDVFKQTEVVEVKTLKGSEAYHEALTMEPLRKFHFRTVALAGCLLLGFFCQTVNGFDGSLFGGLTGELSLVLLSFANLLTHCKPTRHSLTSSMANLTVSGPH